MNNDEKKAFISSLIKSVEKEILDKAHKFPENWNGFQIRNYIADNFRQQAIPLQRGFKKEYENEILINGL